VPEATAAVSVGAFVRAHATTNVGATSKTAGALAKTDSKRIGRASDPRRGGGLLPPARLRVGDPEGHRGPCRPSSGSLYYHFDSKEEIVEAVLTVGVERAFGGTREAVAALGVGADPLARLRTAIATHLRVVLTDSAYASANLRIFGQIPEAIRARHLKLHRAYGAYWRGLFQDAADAGLIRADCDLSVIRMLTLGALNWSVEWYRDGRRSPWIAAEASTMILDGIALGPRSAPPAAPRNPRRRNQPRGSSRVSRRRM
jgi:AcrR family transcriptional regulator